MPNKYDVIIIGAGPAGIFAAYELSVLKPGTKILIIEKGAPLKVRSCPVITKKTKCAKCSPCNVLSGWGGAGAFSDGKLTYDLSIGGHLSEYLDLEFYMKYVKDIYEKFCPGSGEFLYTPRINVVDEFSKKAFVNNLKLYAYTVQHLGTERSLDMLQNMYNWFAENKDVGIIFDTMVENIIVKDNVICGVKTNKDTYESKYVIASPGRDGSKWFADQIKSICGQQMVNRNFVDVGVRMEVPAGVMEDVVKDFYDLKLEYYSKTFNDRLRTFCMCPNGEVIMEKYEGEYRTVNGHSYKNLKTDKTNFSILVSTDFTEPFKNPSEYAKAITTLGNLISDGVIVQRLEDLKKGRRSTEKRISKGFVQPSLTSAVPGDISFVLPYRYVQSILEMIDAIDGLIPGVGSGHNILYAVEAKFYSEKIQVDKFFQTPIENLYAVGDGAGLTRGLMQSSISGVYAAIRIAELLENNNE